MAAFTLAGSPTFSGGKVTIDSTGSDRVTGPVALVSATQFAVAMRCRFRWAGDGTSSHRLLSYRDGDPDGVEVFYYGPYGSMVCGAVVSAGPTQSEARTAYTAAAETDHTIVAYVSAGTLGISVDGSAFSTIARAGGVPTIGGTEFDIGRYSPTNVQWLDGDIYWMVLLSNIPTAAEALALHNFGNTDPTWSAIPGTPTMLWTCDDANYLTSDPGTAGTLTDSSGNSNTAAINGSVPVTTGLFPLSTGARNFASPNTNNYLTAVDSATLDLGNVFSIEAWIKLSSFASSGEERVILSKGAGAYQLAIIPDGRIVARKSGTGTFVASRNPIVLNTPYHVGVTKNGDDARLYLNGVDETGVVTGGITCVDNASSLYIGRNEVATGPFHGVIDDTALYATVLSPERVLAHYLAANSTGTTEIPLTIPGALGTFRVRLDASLQSIGAGRLGDPSDSGPINPWESRGDTVGLGRATSADGLYTYGTWSIVSTPIGNALKGFIPVASTQVRRCDLENGKNNSGFPLTIWDFGTFQANTWTVGLGEDVWFCYEFQLPSDWVTVSTAIGGNPYFFLLLQTGQWPYGFRQPLFSFNADPTSAHVVLTSGAWTNTPETYQSQLTRTVIPVNELTVAPAWHQMVVRWRVAKDLTGGWEIWWRRRGETTWTKTLSVLNIPSLLWDSALGSSSAAMSGRDGLAVYTRGGSAATSVLVHKYARATGPGVLEQFLNS